MHRLSVTLVPCVVATAVFASFEVAAENPAKTTAPYNILLITPDQIRADFIHTYGATWPEQQFCRQRDLVSSCILGWKLDDAFTQTCPVSALRNAGSVVCFN